MSWLGPGFAVAATGVGAGDMVSTTVAGVDFGMMLLWTTVFSAIIKCALNEGLARWQLATGTTLLEAWAERLWRPLVWYALVYLVVWCFTLGAGLMGACGLALHEMWPVLPTWAWSILQALISLGLVVWGRYGSFEKVMGGLVALMFLSIIGTTLSIRPSLPSIVTSLVPTVPKGSGTDIVRVIGGVGGSLSILCYGYWMRERGRDGKDWLRGTRLDLFVAYTFTGVFGMCVLIMAAGVKLPETTTKPEVIVALANHVGSLSGRGGYWLLLLGFWGAAYSSLLGVYQGFPYLFADFVALLKRVSPEERTRMVATNSLYYRGFLLFLVFPPMVMFFTKKPEELVKIYTLLGGLFMPFLAATLLYLNNSRSLPKDLRNGKLSNILLIVALLVFAYLALKGEAG
ncbi:MAG: Nramp family divalent metal transporter [Candidatus Latescibacteria bacterium]|nr:Nramp family divalent metal transporter [Candidatus Latescibacterota bacterium]